MISAQTHLVVSMRLEDVEDGLDVLEIVHASTYSIVREGGVQLRNCSDKAASRPSLPSSPKVMAPYMIRSVGCMQHSKGTRTMTMFNTLFCLFSAAIFRYRCYLSAAVPVPVMVEVKMQGTPSGLHIYSRQTSRCRTASALSHCRVSQRRVCRCWPIGERK